MAGVGDDSGFGGDGKGNKKVKYARMEKVSQLKKMREKERKRSNGKNFEGEREKKQGFVDHVKPQRLIDPRRANECCQ